MIRRSVKEPSSISDGDAGHDCGRRHGRRDAGRDRRGLPRGAAAGFATGAEVAELAGELGVERIVEADGNRHRSPAAAGSPRAARSRTTTAAMHGAEPSQQPRTPPSPLGNGFHDAPGVRLTLPFSSISSTMTSIS